jgi:hypothetical protein
MRWWLIALAACGKHDDPAPTPPQEAAVVASRAPAEVPQPDPPTTTEASCEDAGRAYARYLTGGETERPTDVAGIRKRCERDHWSVKLRDCYLSIIDMETYQVCADIERLEKPKPEKPVKKKR